MPEPRLTPQLISLIHHVELSKSGWREKALKRLIVAALWIEGKPLTRDEIASLLRVNFHVDVSFHELQRLSDSLCGLHLLVQLPNGNLKIEEAHEAALAEQLEEADRVKQAARDKLTEIIASACPGQDANQLWLDFNELLLLPIIGSLGARTYEAISGSSSAIIESPTLPVFLERYPLPQRPCLRASVLRYLHPASREIKAYVLQLLHAHFCMEACSLSQSTLAAVTGPPGTKPQFTVFVDTNVIFSVLELHENPANEGTQLLPNLAKSLEDRIDVQLRILPPTVEETKRSIMHHLDLAKDIRFVPNLAEAALLDGPATLSGVTKKFVIECQKARRAIDAQHYFGPYIENLVTILRAKGIELYNDNLDHLSSEQAVIDDILEQRQHQADHTPDHVKSYEMLKHDVVLWHYVDRKRPSLVESPLSARFWVVTVDYRFLGFDAYKRRHSPASIPVCIHPAALIQLLQFWVPRTQEFEDALFGSILAPFFAEQFDHNAEAITLRILGILSRFDNAADLPQEAVGDILLNNALRERIQSNTSVQQQIALVKEALVEQVQSRTRQLHEALTRTSQLSDDLKAKTSELADLTQTLQLQAEQTRLAQQAAGVEHEARLELGNQVAELSRTVQTVQHRSQRNRFILLHLALPLFMVASLTYCIILAIQLLAGVFISYLAWLLPLLCSLGLAWHIDVAGLHTPGVYDSPLFRRFHKLRKWIFAAIAALLTGLLVNFLWEVVKQWPLVKRFLGDP